MIIIAVIIMEASSNVSYGNYNSVDNLSQQ